ncbi:dimeric alpha-beta barrel [Fusarium sp. NRRL 25303]|nr:dimeric alpha-beta barrel [Fusarium sp. NRRL 25303]
MAQILILYPSGPSFDLDYYLKSHIPLVSKVWGPLGLQGWDVLTFPTGAPYQVQVTLKWKSLEAYEQAATGKPAEGLFGDIKNFTTAEPILLKGSVVGSSVE